MNLQSWKYLVLSFCRKKKLANSYNEWKYTLKIITVTLEQIISGIFLYKT